MHSDKLVVDSPVIVSTLSHSAHAAVEREKEKPNEDGFPGLRDEKSQPANLVPLLEALDGKLPAATREIRATNGSPIPPLPPKLPDAIPHEGDRLPLPTESTRINTAVDASIHPSLMGPFVPFGEFLSTSSDFRNFPSCVNTSLARSNFLPLGLLVGAFCHFLKKTGAISD